MSSFLWSAAAAVVTAPITIRLLTGDNVARTLTIITAALSVFYAGANATCYAASGVLHLLGAIVADRAGEASRIQSSALSLAGWSRVSLVQLTEQAEIAFDDTDIDRARQRKRSKKKKAWKRSTKPTPVPTNSSANLSDILAHQDVCFLRLQNDTLELFASEPGSDEPALVTLILRHYTVMASPGAAVSPGQQCQYRKSEPLVLRSTDADDTLPVYFYFPTATAKEDWHLSVRLAICRASPTSSDNCDMLINTGGTEATMQQLIRRVGVTIHSAIPPKDAKPLPSIAGDPTTQWFNAIVGRIFMVVSTTDWLQDLVESKLRTKLSSIKRPPMLGPISVRSFEIGTGAPMIYNAKLQRLSFNGETDVEFDMVYEGPFRLEIETDVTIDTGISSIGLRVVFRIEIRKISGAVILKLKRPPSNRLWWGFRRPGPDLDVVVTPTVSDTSLNFTIVRQAIERRMQEIVKDSLVEPNMDDITLPGMGNAVELLISQLSSTNGSRSGLGHLLSTPVTPIVHAGHRNTASVPSGDTLRQNNAYVSNA